MADADLNPASNAVNVAPVDDLAATVIAAALDGIIVMDEDGRIAAFNPAAERMFGYQREAVLGRTLAEVLPRDVAEPAMRAVKRALTEGGTQVIEVDLSIQGAVRTHAVRIVATEDDEVVSIVRDVTERKLIEAQFHHQAFHDGLTDFPHRALFVDRLRANLAESGRTPRLVAILFIDLDDFKTINDGLGAAAGDRLLVMVGERLRASLRGVDMLARFGGNEFRILLDGVATRREITRIAERLLTALKSPFVLDDYEVDVHASIGVAMAEPGMTAEDLIRAADQALSRAKAVGRRTYAHFESNMEAAAARLDLEADLRRALERDELRLAYQPVFALATGRLVEVEALLRWDHPERGAIAPNTFLPLAEETGLIIPIGQRAMREVCRQGRTWQQQFSMAVDLTVSVNLSVQQLRQPDLITQVEQILRQTGLAPASLKLEITEHAVFANAVAIGTTLQDLRALGVRLALDDFGTGYSSLSHLRWLAIDTIKLDRSFTDGLSGETKDRAIVAAITTLAHSLGLDVTAEQLAAVRAAGCDHGQGHHLAPPVSADRMDALLGGDG